MNEIFHRASIRNFIPQEVEEEKIINILKAAMASPSAKNGRPWEFYVVTNKQMLTNLAGATPHSTCIQNAPAAIVVCYRKENEMSVFQEIDCAIATENILLEIDSQGLGGVMIGICPKEEEMKKVEEILSIDESLRVFTIIPFGYPISEKEQPDRFEPARIHYIK